MKQLSNTTALQVSQVFRYTILLGISVLLAKSNLSAAEISVYETFIFLSTVLSHFWTSSVVQSLLAVYKKPANGDCDNRSEAYFNAFLVLLVYSIVIGTGIGFFSGMVSRMFNGNPVGWLPFYLVVYLILNNPSFLVEPIYLLQRNPVHLLVYGFISYTLQLGLVTLPLFSGFSLESTFIGLIISSAIRTVWLLVLLYRHSLFRISSSFMKKHMLNAIPLAVYAVIAASEEYIGGMLVKWKFSAEAFAIYRFGAKELPVSFLLANALSNAMVPAFSGSENRESALRSLKRNSLQLMHIIFPVSIALMIFSDRLYPLIFNSAFASSAAIFNIFLLLAIGRAVFPQTILLGMRKSRVLVTAVSIEAAVNFAVSAMLLTYAGIMAPAWGLLAGFITEKIFMIAWCRSELNIAPSEYIPIIPLIIYSAILSGLYFVVSQFNFNT